METPNNHKAIQVENLKTALDEWKHVVVKVDSIINTEDPIKRAASQILASSCLYAIFYLLSVSIWQLYWPWINIVLTLFLAKHFDSCFGSSDDWSRCWQADQCH